ncbi:MAG: ABC transporter ATP-binding protein/permease [Defluviitaleaceae bacterium]|nr:ABC transporter ATP-binding protein/permease [Defluviitaleaceae bacterium]
MSNNQYQTAAKDKILAIGWGFKLAWKINKKLIMFWYCTNILLAVLPAIILIFNRDIISVISNFLASGAGDFSDVVPRIIAFGALLTVSGLSARINGDLLFYIMYDSYYLGMQEVLIQKSNKISPDTLLDKEIKDEFGAITSRAGSLSALISGSCMLVSQFVSIASMLVVAVSVSWIIAVVTAFYVVGIIIFKLRSVDKSRPTSGSMRDRERFARYFQNLSLDSNIAKEIRIYESKNDIINQWRLARNHLDDEEKQRLGTREKFSFFSSIGFVVFTVGILLYSIINVSRGNMMPDVFLLLYGLCFSISGVARNVTRSIGQFDYGLFSIERQRRFIKTTPEMMFSSNEALIASKNNEIAIEFKNVTFGYKLDLPVLKNINLKIKHGETIALVGHNGSGKTTLANLIINRFQPQQGELRLNGIPYADYPEGGIEEYIGIFFQNYYLFHASIKDNIAWGDIKQYNNETKIDEAMNAAGVDKLLNKLSVKDDRWVNRHIISDGVVMSGGENQRLALARSYMSDRPILIFDEPAAALDPIAEMEQFHSIRNRLSGRTNILISHRIGFARLADRIIVMQDGEIIEDSIHEELIKQNGVYAYLYNEQAQWYTKAMEVTTV